MKSKKTIGLLIAIVCFLISCDYVNQPYTVPGPNGCTSPEPGFSPRTDPKKKVLIEDFTGHFCGSCPSAHRVLDTMFSKPAYKESVVAIAHHSSYAGTFTDPWSTVGNPELQFIYDFRNTISTELDYKYNGISYPSGLVNRKDFGAGPLVGHSTWQGYTDNLLNLPQQVDIQIKPIYDPIEKTICAYYYVDALADLVGEYKISLYLTEDSIIQWQKNSSTVPIYVPNYVHNHVMRISFNGLFGTKINPTGSITSGDTFIDGYSVSVSGTDWNIHHLYIVAFVYNEATDEIIQAEQVKVIP